MAFFLIVPSVMIVSVLLIHALANRLGLRIYYTTLIAVAVVSVMVNLAAATITPAIGREYLLRLGLMILAAAALLTWANRFLLQKELADEKRFQDEVRAAYEAEKQKDFELAEKPLDKFKWNDEDNLIDAPPAYNESSAAEETPLEKSKPPIEEDTPLEESEPPVKKDMPLEESEPPVEKDMPLEESEPPVKEETPLEESEPPVEEDTPLENAESSIAADKFPLEKVFEPLPEVKPEEADKPIKLEEKPAEKSAEENFPLEEVFKPLSDVKPEEVKHFDTPPEKKSDSTELFPLQEVFRPLSTLNLDKLEEITQEEKSLPHEEETNPEEKIDTLDELLDKAYAERDKGNIWQAIETYKKALERYRNDEYAPFVAIDLGNIYKERAMYSKAIKVYEDALTLPTVERNPSTKKEFADKLEYLRVLHEVLVRHHALSTPFNLLSREILQEIDTEFKNAQINSPQ